MEKVNLAAEQQTLMHDRVISARIT